MKRSLLIYLLAALAIGIGTGYLLFGGSSSKHESGQMETHTEADHAEDETTWTCSMHPQIQRDEPGDCPICGMDLIPLQSGNSDDPTVLTMTEAAVALARVSTITVGAANMVTNASDDQPQAGLKLTGRLAPDERTTSVQSAHVAGRIERMLVTFPGEGVGRGQQIASIYAPELVIAQEELLQAKAFAEVNPALVTAARNKLLNLKVSAAQIEALEALGTAITNFPVYAERGGTVTEIKVEVGQYVPAGGALYTLTQLNKLWALFDTYENDLSRVRVGDRLTFSVSAYPDEIFTAKVSFIDPLINPTTRTATVRAEVNNRRGKLKPQMFINGLVEIRTDRKAGQAANDQPLVVPKTAVLWTGTRSVVYVEVPDTAIPTYEFKEVTLGDRTGDGYLVLAGLQAGEKVVVKGAFSIDAAAQLNNKASMMNRKVLIQGREAVAVTQMTVPDYREETPAAFKAQLTSVVEAYLSLKDQLVATSMIETASVDSVLTSLESVNMGLIEAAAHDYWMEQLKAIKAHLEALGQATDVAGQRKQFGFFSQALINALMAFGVNEALYVQHCPMAFDNAGANWISDVKEIRNPYFGDQMLTCGSVTEELY